MIVNSKLDIIGNISSNVIVILYKEALSNELNNVHLKNII